MISSSASSSSSNKSTTRSLKKKERSEAYMKIKILKNAYNAYHLANTPHGHFISLKPSEFKDILIKNEKNNFYLFQDPKEILSKDCSILNYQFYVKYSIDIDSKIGKFVAEPSIN